MLVINLPQFPYRGITAPYLWMFYKALSAFREDTHYIIHNDYLNQPEKWTELKRWEVDENTQRNLGYQIPNTDFIKNLNYSLTPDEIFANILERAESNPLKAFELILSKVVPELSLYYQIEIEAISRTGKIEAILTPINCPSLKEVAQLRGIPLIHFELGPLRGPNYIDLAYFDFEGLNEKSEFDKRLAASNCSINNEDLLNLAAVRKKYLKGDYWLCDPSSRTPKFDLGVPLQIEDDTNLIASGNSFNNQALIAYSKLKFPDKAIAYKAHPGSFFEIKLEKGGVKNYSGTDFLFDCNSILTINSSMGFEGLLWGKRVFVLGHSAYASIVSMEFEKDRDNFLIFYLTNYLVPFELIFNHDYISFRIKNPTEHEIKKVHLSELLRIQSAEVLQIGGKLIQTCVNNANSNKTYSAHDNQIYSLSNALAERDDEIHDLNNALADRDYEIHDLKNVLAERDGQITGISNALNERNVQITSLNKALTERDGQITSLGISVSERDSNITKLNLNLIERDRHINSQNLHIKNITDSLSWKITQPFRKILSRIKYEKLILFKKNLPDLEFVLFKIFNSVPLQASAKERIRSILFNKFHFLFRNFNAYSLWKERIYQGNTLNYNPQFDTIDSLNWVIQSPKHTLFIAHLIKEQLEKFNWDILITSDEIDKFEKNTLYIILCPQVFKSLPPGENRIIYQLEQSVSSRWFTDNYFEILNNSLAVIDYSLTNIKYLSDNGIKYPHVYYLPIGASYTYGNNIPATTSNDDIVFYGDSFSSPRRRHMLNELQKHFKVSIYNDLFGENLLKVLKNSKLVINIHYYDGALLEMPRIQECLSLGVKVISEESPDVHDYPELNNDVVFFPSGDSDRMIELVKEFYRNERYAKITSISKSHARFSFMFDRILIGMNIIPASHVKNIMPHIGINTTTFGLSLPESIDRRHTFLEIKPDVCQIFDGIRRKPGWIGCGLSYKYLAMHSMKNNLSKITIMEDDVTLPGDYNNQLRIINEFLELQHNNWDIFSGVIASLDPKVKILDAKFYKGFNFVTIDKMTSMVYNIYNTKAIKLLSEWNPNCIDTETNTIDRYLESKTNLRVIVMLPFFVGHREEVKSTLWGFQNTQYSKMIQESQSSLYSKLEIFSKHNENS
jgi:hypothetical protein